MFSKDDIDNIIDMYINHNKNTVQIASIYNCNNTTIGRLLRKNGIDVNKIANDRKKKQFTDKEIKDICEKYNKGYTSIEICKIYNCADTTITKLLRENKITIREAKRRSIIKHHDYFKNINTPNKAYFLGLLISDGCVVKPNRNGREDVISLSLKLSDKYLVECFAIELGALDSSVKEYTSNGRNECYFRFSSQEMSDDLFRYGVTYNKSKSTYIPLVDDNLMPHLIRGIFDGDGTVYLHKKGKYKYIRFGFYGSKNLCEQVSIILNKYIGANMNKIIEKEGCHMIVWQGKDISLKFHDYIYSDTDIYLKRKKLKFENNIR